MTGFIPHTPDEWEHMMAAVGVKSSQELFSQIPSSLKTVTHPNHLPLKGLSELELIQELATMAPLNTGAAMESFQGGGAYHRFIPPAIANITSRSEFYTAYTPYQPEISQGTLQMIYEFQTMICELTGMDVANASVYDGANALVESALMALRVTKRTHVLMSQTLHPQTQQILKTYLDALGGITLVAVDTHRPLEGQLQGSPKDVAAVLVQQPDYLGSLHQTEPLSAFCEASGALLVACVDPFTLGLLASPGSWGGHIVCGDIQPFGNAVNYGGPYAGFMATRQAYVRQLPGRIVGRTRDKNDQMAYTLTLQTREQHIRREKATSNICTNQSLNVLKASVYLALTGPKGLRQLAMLSAKRARTLASGLCSIPGVSMRFEDQPYLYEFAVKLPMPAEAFIRQMTQRFGILPGIDMGKYWPAEDHTLLVAVTEMNSPASIGHYLDAAKATIREPNVAAIHPKTTPFHAPIVTGTLGDTHHG